MTRSPVHVLSVCLVALALASMSPSADSTIQPLPLGQNWADTTLITTSDSWSGVPGVIGYRGDGLTSTTGVDPQTVLGRQAQLDVANQLASEQRYADAAEAYESFLKFYKGFEQVEQVELMLGLIYARYLNKYPSAKELLLRAMARLHSDNQLNLARSELARIEPLIG